VGGVHRGAPPARNGGLPPDEDARRRDATGGEPRPRGSANFVSRSESLVRGDASASVASFRGAEDGTA